MFYTNSTFIGIDPTAGEKPFVYAALDRDLQLLALGHGTIDDVMAFAAGQRQAVVAVCAPRQPNQGVMTRPEIRQDLTPPPTPGRWTNFRLADYMLRQHNLSIPQTPSNEDNAPNWMRNGFTLFHRLEMLGYRTYPETGADRQNLEVYPYACYSVLLGILPFPKHTLEGRLQRQLALFDREVDVPDAMLFFEEITRHRLLKGVLPLETLFSPGELDALIAAYTAWLAALHSEKVTLLGDPNEGQVVLPGVDLKSRY
jgi:Protein of unknown function (DUF429)